MRFYKVKAFRNNMKTSPNITDIMIKHPTELPLQFDYTLRSNFFTQWHLEKFVYPYLSISYVSLKLYFCYE